jgi:hypothetical protein
MVIGDKPGPIPVASTGDRLAFFEKFYSRARPPVSTR